MAKTTYQITMQDEATQVLRNLASSVQNLQKNVEGLSAAKGLEILGGAWEKLSGVITSSLDAYADAERQTTKLNAILDATGNTTGFTRQALQEMANQLQRQTGIDGDVVKSAEAILSTYKNLQGDGFQRTLDLSADLAKFWDGDMDSAAKNLGQMMEKPSEAFGKLKKQGVVLDDAVESTVKHFEDLGDITSAQNVLMDELEKRYGGTAQAMRQDLQGSIDAAETAFGDLQERIGEGFAPAAQAGLEILREVMEVISSLPPGVVAGATAFATLAVGIPIVVTALNKAKVAAMAFGLTMQSTAGVVGLAVGAIAAVAIAISNQSDQAAKDVEDMADRTVTAYKNILNAQNGQISAQIRLSYDQLDKLKTRRDNTEKEIASTEKRIAELSKKISSGKTARPNSEEIQELVTLRKSLENLKQYRDADNKAIVEVDDNTKKLTATYNENTKAINEQTRSALKAKSDAVEEYLQKLRDELASLGLSEVAKLKYEKSLKDATRAQKDEAAELTRKIGLKQKEIAAEEEAAKKIEDAKKAIDDHIAALIAQQATIGMTTDELAAYEDANLAAAVAGDAEYQKKIEQMLNLESAVKKLTHAEELRSKAEGLKAQLDPSIDLEKKLAEYAEMVDQGLLDQGQYLALCEQAWKDYGSAASGAANDVDKIPTALDKIKESMPIVEQAVSQIMNIISNLNTMMMNSEKARMDAILAGYDEQLSALEDNYNAQVDLAESLGEDTSQIEADYEKRKAALEEERARRQDEYDRQAFENNKAMSLVSAAVNTALAVTNALANTPAPFNIPMAALVGAAGATEIAMIASQQYTPRLAEGGVIMPRAGGTLVNVGEANWPEAVIPLKQGLGGLGGGNTQTIISIQGQVYGSVDDMAKTIDRAQRRRVARGIA